MVPLHPPRLKFPWQERENYLFSLKFRVQYRAPKKNLLFVRTVRGPGLGNKSFCVRSDPKATFEIRLQMAALFPRPWPSEVEVKTGDIRFSLIPYLWGVNRGHTQTEGLVTALYGGFPSVTTRERRDGPTLSVNGQLSKIEWLSPKWAGCMNKLETIPVGHSKFCMLNSVFMRSDLMTISLTLRQSPL